jgi:cbb3-type cytochrome oxidase maturation protein
MSVIVMLIAFSFIVAGGFLAAFLWAVRTGQYEDRHTPSIRILFDDRPRSSKQNQYVSNHDQQPAA